MAIADVMQDEQRASLRQVPSTYDRWVVSQGIPVVRGFHIQDLKTMPLEPWNERGGLGAFLMLDGQQEALTDGYVCEIPPRATLTPQKHLFEELVYVVKGRGSTTLWYDESHKQTFEWQAGSLFSLPINVWHQHFNGSGTEPARFYAVTDAPLILNLFHNLDFVFRDDFRFTDRFSGHEGEFSGEGQYLAGRTWETNFIPDVSQFELRPHPTRGGGRNMCFEIGNSSLTAHSSEFPVGNYKKAHRHGPGANVVILTGQGYSLIWPKDGSAVQRIDWQPGSIFVPPNMWLHQHFNTSPIPVRYIALRWNSQQYPVFKFAEGQDLSVKDGGNQIEFEDEDPWVLDTFAEECAKHGAKVEMSRFFPNRTF